MPRGSAFEKAIFGPLDDQARDKARREIHDALDELKVDVDFTRADLKDQLAMLGENIRATNSELAQRIEKLDPVHIEKFIVQNVKPTIINVFIKMDPEEVRLLSGIAGMLPSELPAEEIPEKVGAVLFDNVNSGTLLNMMNNSKHLSNERTRGEGVSSSIATIRTYE